MHLKFLFIMKFASLQENWVIFCNKKRIVQMAIVNVTMMPLFHKQK